MYSRNKGVNSSSFILVFAVRQEAKSAYGKVTRRNILKL